MNRFRCAVVFGCVVLVAQLLRAEDVRREIQLPDLPGYQTLACDFHLHTVFSDGLVWPTVRVTEAWRQGLDAIALTDHIEYQPHKDDIPTRHGRSHELVIEQAKTLNVLVIRAAEITRDTPPGHFNALFLQDVQALDTADFLGAIEQANQQQAFVFWNHQGWKGPEQGQWLAVHTSMYEKKWLHGMEICNGSEYYPDGHKWALEKNLTLVGNSDIHDTDLRTESKANDHRTMTLVFAQERSVPAIAEALREGRTLVWYNDQVIGRDKWLVPFLQSCLEIHAPHRRDAKAAFVEIRNLSDIALELERLEGAGPQQLALPARATTVVRVAASGDAALAPLRYAAKNFLLGPDTPASVTLTIPAARP